MAEIFNLSPSSTQYRVYLEFKLKDKITGIVYFGSILLGERNHLRPLSIDSLIQEVTKWISIVRFPKSPQPIMVIQFNIPTDQQILLMEFSTPYLIIDLVRNLGVPVQEIYNASFEIVHLECSVVGVPRNSTILSS